MEDGAKMKVGKFSRKTLGFDMRMGTTLLQLGGAANVNKKIWFGPINKNTAAGNSMMVNLRGPTWGFTWIDYCEIHTRCHMGTTLGQARGTVGIVYNQNPTLLLSVTLNFQNRGFLYIVGRTGGRS